MWDNVRRQAYQLLIVLLGIVLCIEFATWPISYAGHYRISFCTQRHYFGLEISKGTCCLSEQAASPDDLDGFARGWDFESGKPRDIRYYIDSASEPCIAHLPGIVLSEGWSLGPSDHYYVIYVSQLLLLLLTIGILGLLSVPILRRRRHKRAARGLCQSCGYDLRVHRAGDKCPECGTPIPPRPDIITGPRSNP